MDDVQRKMDAQEKLIADYKARQGANLPEQLMANLATLERLNGQIERNRDWQQRLFERRETLARYARPDAIPDIGPETAEQRIVRLREDLGQLRLRYSDSHPDVAQLRSQIGSLEKDLANAAAAPAEANGKVVTAAAAAPPPSFPREDRELDRLRVEEQDLRRQYAMYQSRVEAAPARDHELRELTRDYEASKALYASLFQRHAETRLAGRLEQRRADERFRVLDEAVVPSKPLGPDRPRLILLVVAGAIGAAFAAALLLERLDTTFHATEQLRGTRVPILQGIPRIRTAHGALARGMTGFAVAAGGLALLSAVFLVCYRVALENTDLSILALRGAGS
jgi:uncharacterized protein involved in exopolysaccharide biosynthesis